MLDRRRTRWGPMDLSTAPLPSTPQAATLDPDIDHERVRAASSKLRRLVLSENMPKTDQSPLKEYAVIMKGRQAGTILVACQKSGKQERLFAIKRIRSCSKDQLRQLRMARHENLLMCNAAYHWQNSVYLINDFLKHAVPLSVVIRNPRSKLRQSDFTAVGHSLLSGINFIHTQLQTIHGRIHIENVLVTTEGRVKLANWADSMLDKTRTDRQTDLKSSLSVMEEVLSATDISEDEIKEIQDFMGQVVSTEAAGLLKSSLAEYAFVASILEFPSVTIFPKDEQSETMCVEDALDEVTE
ncbi:hypothetical protein LTR70_004879 [Exophiala xenobiotica]|uniref:Protein kinase domain-containing protein n=1 Tax=Lithohypha guttulata TaxID=1690604 RepID=A0ABR0KBW1_9EURO|nr:hypothetical protein LTR24_004497 [Lithohypha guttulata]KAK5319834.1 hypothetical protein LTR70_004879 [Exophiala xenobiotica]